MKIKKSHLKELIRQSIKSIVSEEDVMDKKIKYKTDDGEEKEATIGGILKQGEDHPAHDKAQAMVDKGGEKKPTKTTKISADPFGDKDEPHDDMESPDRFADDPHSDGSDDMEDPDRFAPDEEEPDDVDFDQMSQQDLDQMFGDMGADEPEDDDEDDSDWDMEDPDRWADDEPEGDVGGPAHPNVPKKEPSKPKVNHKKIDRIGNLGNFAKVDAEKYPGDSKDPKVNKVTFYVDKILNNRKAIVGSHKTGEVQKALQNIKIFDKQFSEWDKDFEVLGDIMRDYGDYGPGGKFFQESVKEGGEGSGRKKGSGKRKFSKIDKFYSKGYKKKIGTNVKKLSKKEKAAKKKKDDDFFDRFNKIGESKVKRFTVKEVQKWMKTLEENRYKKVYNADCRRVSWMANNMREDITNMPKSMSKKWTKAQYGRERYLAREFVKSKLSNLKEQLVEQKLRKMIREILTEKKNKGLWHNIHAKRKRGEKPAKKGDKDYPKTLDIEGKLAEAPQKGKHVVYYEKGSSGKKVLDVKPNYKSASLAMNKHMNTGKYNTVGIQHWEDWNKVESPKIKEGLGSALLPTFKVFIKGYKKPFRVAAMDSRDAKKVAHQMMRNNKVKIQKVVHEGKLTEAKFKKVILPNDKKSQTILSKIIKKMNLRYQKDYNMLAHGSGPLKAKGGNQVITILPKHYNKFLELSMKNKLNVRG
mgnify:FL=1